jgi:hypothetical protein
LLVVTLLSTEGDNCAERITFPQPESEMSSSTFRDFFSLGAGVTPAEGSVKPTAGFTLNKVISPSPHPRDIALTIPAVTSPVDAFPPTSRVSTLPALSTDAVAARIFSPAA